MCKNTIAIGSDHAGFELKKKLIDFLEKSGYEVCDKGAYSFEEQDDYPDFIKLVAIAVENGSANKGIVLGGSGQGEAIMANRTKGVRACVYYGGQEEIISLSRRHNNANILSLGARFISSDEAKKATRLWLETEFSEDERHSRRIDKLDKK